MESIFKFRNHFLNNYTFPNNMALCLGILGGGGICADQHNRDL